MEPHQEFEWNEAQKIALSVDLVAVAKQQLKFLAAVDKNRHLYDGLPLQRAIYRYNACWLPLLAKHSETPILEGPLVVPLDCEWVWHCHRLNPVRYKSDCEELYGRILDNFDVVSTAQGIFQGQTEEIWNKMYPDEPYNVDLLNVSSEDINERIARLAKYTKYDLVSAAKRQGPFFYQVSRPHMNDDLFIEEAVARYKGFLHLIKRNKEMGVKRFCVPTYDVDLIWHSHQLNPVSYCKDLKEILGKVLEHDDTDSDRTKGQKLDVGFSGTTKQWEDTFGTSYWRAGAMYRGIAPTPITIIPYTSNMIHKKVITSIECPQEIQFQDRKVVEVLLEFVAVKNLPEGKKGIHFVTFSKSQPDAFFDAKRRLSILSETGEKQVASFQCEPTGELHFELLTHSSSNLSIRKSSKTLGSASFSFQNCLEPVSKLSVEKWLEMVPRSDTMSSKPILLRVAISFTAPVPAPYMIEMVQPRPLSKNSCFFNLPMKPQHAKGWTHVTDETGSKIFSLQMRDLKMAKDASITGKEVIGLLKSGETCTLAKLLGNEWSLMDNLWSFQLPSKCEDDGHLFELKGSRMVKVFPGRKLDYEPKHFEKQGKDMDYLTAVEFSTGSPYGKAVALLDLKSAFVKAKEKWIVLPATILAFIASDIRRREGYEGIISKNKDSKISAANEEMNGLHEESKMTDLTHQTIVNGKKLNFNGMPGKTGHDAASCDSCEGAGHKNKVESAACGGCGTHCGGHCGGGFGNGWGGIVTSGACGGCGTGCGGHCGGGFGNGWGGNVTSGACGGCGTGCGGHCGGGFGNGWGVIVEGGNCGGCGGECGDGIFMNKSGGGVGSDLVDSKCSIDEQQERPSYVNEAVAAA